MKTKILLILLLIAAFGYYDNRGTVDNFMQQKVNYLFPCSYPMTYSIGGTDRRFKITKEELRTVLGKAEKLWEDGVDKELFQYEETGGALTIDLVYDERQATTDTLRTIGDRIDDNQANHNDLRTEYDTLLAQFNLENAELQKQLGILASARRSYEKDVADWNSQGRAHDDEYLKLESRRTEVNRLVDEANTTQARLNDMADRVNTLANRVNGLIGDLQLNVEKFNTVSSSNEFNEGEYMRDALGQRIAIYEFGDDTELLRVLTHEMGHALNMDHVDDKAAIMYRVNQGKSEKLTEADIMELRRVCRLQ